ncbi:hypothetical protein [Oscillatoria acuminata]|uniref:Uncharacterized protein n=1 Tax=Oscillatoria acuminata PCC 6304 TaxID=56110 RepID=K9TNX1_9CYAN|nr:hypothetical protein [Oscillatoria acuminata]AFY83826.1 hypothetical protein Oscil6304_4300 [Oscillatoria acuminata PCC 6304]
MKRRFPLSELLLTLMLITGQWHFGNTAESPTANTPGFQTAPATWEFSPRGNHLDDCGEGGTKFRFQ